MKRVLLAVLVALVPAALAAQQPAPPVVRLTMDEAIRRALSQGEEVGLARAAVDQAHAQVVQARADALPQVRAGLTYQRTFASPFVGGNTGPTFAPFAPDTTLSDAERIRYLENEYPNMLPRGISDLFRATPFGRENTYVGTLSLTQTLLQGGKVGAALRGARAYENAASHSWTRRVPKSSSAPARPISPRCTRSGSSRSRKARATSRPSSCGASSSIIASARRRITTCCGRRWTSRTRSPRCSRRATGATSRCSSSGSS